MFPMRSQLIWRFSRTCRGCAPGPCPRSFGHYAPRSLRHAKAKPLGLLLFGAFRPALTSMEAPDLYEGRVGGRRGALSS